MATDSTTTRPEHLDVGYEEKDVHISGVLKAGVSLVALVVIAMVALVWMFDAFTAREADNKRSRFPLAQQNEVPPAPLLEAVERKEQGQGKKVAEPLETDRHARGGIPPLGDLGAFLKGVKVSENAGKKPAVLPSDANSGRFVKGGEK